MSSLAAPAATMLRILSSGYRRLAIQGFGGRFVRLAHAHGIDDDEMGLLFGVGRDALQVVGLDDPATSALHLLEIRRRVDVPHEQQAFQRLYIGAGGDHIDRHGNAWVVGIAELVQQVVGLLAGRFRGDLLAEVVAPAKLLPNDLHDVVGMEVGLGEDQRFGDFGAAREDFGKQAVTEGADDQPDLIHRHHVPVKIVGRIGQVVIEFLEFPLAGSPIPMRNELARLPSEHSPILRHAGFDPIHVVADVDAIDDRLFVAVVLDEVAVERSRPFGQWARTGFLSAQMRPECCITMVRQIARPSPVPPFWRESEASTCWKRPKMDSSLSAGIPRP